MKTLEELLEETKQIQSLVTNLHGEISEMIHAKEEQGKDVDFASILRTAERHPIKPHPLGEKDAHTVEAYLTLLLSVAAHGTSPETQDNPLVYPCRIAAALRPAPDMELLFKRSLILDEKAVNEALTAVEREHLVDLFVLDSLRLIELYDRGNLQKIEYVSDLAALMNVSMVRMNDLLEILKASLEEWGILAAEFQEVEFFPFLKYLSFKKYFVRTQTEILIGGRDGVEDQEIKEFFPLQQRKRISLENVRFHGDVNLIKIKDVTNLRISGCTFDNFGKSVFLLEKIGCVEIVGCCFKQCARSYSDANNAASTLKFGVIGTFKEIRDDVILKDCEFDHCKGYIRGDFTGALNILYGDKYRLFRCDRDQMVKVDNCRSSVSCPIV